MYIHTSIQQYVMITVLFVSNDGIIYTPSTQSTGTLGVGCYHSWVKAKARRGTGCCGEKHNDHSSSSV